MAIVHISEAEASRDFAAVLARVRSGAVVYIEDGVKTVAVLHASSEQPTRSLSEAIRWAEEQGSQVTLDDQFGDDLEEVIRSHAKGTLRNPWLD